MGREKDVIERWRELLTSYNAISGRLDRELSESYGLRMSDFETLDRLVGCGGDKCRMQVLESEMYLSQGALSRAVARLERAGLVTRAMCEDDRRGVFVEVTAEGRRVHTKAHKAWLGILTDSLEGEPVAR